MITIKNIDEFINKASLDVEQAEMKLKIIPDDHKKIINNLQRKFTKIEANRLKSETNWNEEKIKNKKLNEYLKSIENVSRNLGSDENILLDQINNDIKKSEIKLNNYELKHQEYHRKRRNINIDRSLKVSRYNEDWVDQEINIRHTKAYLKSLKHIKNGFKAKILA